MHHKRSDYKHHLLHVPTASQQGSTVWLSQLHDAGSMIIRRTKWSVWFLQHLYNDYRVWQQGGQRGQEQGAINQFAEDQADLFNQHTAIIPCGVFNQHRWGFVICHVKSDTQPRHSLAVRLQALRPNNLESHSKTAAGVT